MLRFDSILSRIVFLHVVAIVATAILMPLVLFSFLNSEVEDLQHQSMREQADALLRHLVPRAGGGFSFDLSAALRDQYSTAYGRYSYAILDEAGRVLFSSRGNRVAVFPADKRSSEIEYLETRYGEGIISGVSLRRQIDNRTVWIQIGEDLAHRDVIIDDVVARFFSAGLLCQSCCYCSP